MKGKENNKNPEGTALTLNSVHCKNEQMRREKRNIQILTMKRYRDSDRAAFKTHPKKGKSNGFAGVLSRPYKMTP